MELRIIWDILYRRRLLGLGVFSGFFLMVIFFTLVAPKSYEAVTKVTVEKSDKLSTIMTGLGLSGTVLGGRVDDDYSFDTDMELAMISPLVKELLDKLDIKDSRGKRLKTEKFLRSGIGSKLGKQPAIEIDQYNDSSMLSFTATSPSAEQAAEIANLMAVMYSDSLSSRLKQDFVDIRQYIDTSLNTTREQYYQLLVTVKDFQVETGAISLDSEISNLITRITETKRDIDILEQNIEASKKSMVFVRDELAKTDKFWDSFEEIEASSYIKTLKTKLSELIIETSLLDATITANHQKYIGIQNEIDKIKELLKQEAEVNFSRKTRTVHPVYEKLMTSLSDAIVSLGESLSRKVIMAEQLARYQARLMSFPGLLVQSSKMNAELTVLSDLYSSLLKYSMQISMAESVAVSKIRIVEPADVPDEDRPSFPNSIINVLLGLIFGTFFGLTAVFIREYTDDAIKNKDDLATSGAFPLLGFVGHKKTITQSDQRLLEEAKAIRDSISYGNQGHSASIILVSSASTGGGASTIACGLAKAYAERQEEVLLVDLNLRNPACHRFFAMDKGTGVSEVLRDSADLSACLTATEIENLTLLSAGADLDDCGRLIDSKKMATLLTDLRGQFKTVILDTPSLTAFNDAFSLSYYADMVVLVARVSGSTISGVETIMGNLTRAEVSHCGLVLNSAGYSLSLRDIPQVIKNFSFKRFFSF